MTLKNCYVKEGRSLLPSDLNIISNGAIIFDSNEIIWLGPTDELNEADIDQTFDLSGHTLTPEIVDAHTHLVFGGDRSEEYSWRLNGEDYQEIANKGGGILSTVEQTKKSSEQDLFDSAVKRIEKIHQYGVGTIEIKSGYGLDYQTEKKISIIIDRLQKKFHPKVQIQRTYMAAHAIPQGLTAQVYLNETVLPLMEELAQENLIDAVDIFHEVGYFESGHVQELFARAKLLGLKTKMHADEFNDNKGAEIACNFNCLSADHLLKINPVSIKKLAQSETVANILPGTALFLGKPLAPAKELLDQGVRLSISSDYNPGSSHIDNVLLVASMSAPSLKLNQAQLWSALTLNAAYALGMTKQGALVKGLKPRFSLFKTESLAKITYHWTENFAVTLP